MNIKSWTKPGTSDVRFYLDTKFGGAKYACRSLQGAFAGRWIAADHNGMAASFEKGPTGPRKGEDGQDVDAYLRIEGMTFAEFARLVEAASTAGGNWSEVRWFKLPEIVARIQAVAA